MIKIIFKMIIIIIITVILVNILDFPTLASPESTTLNVWSTLFIFINNVICGYFIFIQEEKETRSRSNDISKFYSEKIIPQKR